MPPDLHRKGGGLTMVTYSDLIQTGILVVAIIALFIQANKKK
nr:MAG TPA: Membrane MotB of proton-channel complex MotA/MotB [Caudoviricetes sp.]